MYNFVNRKNCPVCEQNDGKTLFVEKFSDGETGEFISNYYQDRISLKLLGDAEYRLIKCNNCLLIYQKYILDDDGMADLYERAIDPDQSLNKRERATSKYFTGLIADTYRIGKLLPNITPQDLRVLDFGMGWGHWCIAARSRGYTVMGAELSQKRIAFAQKNGTIVTDPFDPSENQCFDFINTDQVFEHLPNPRKILSQLVRKLNPGGILKIFVPNATRDETAMRLGRWTSRKDAFHPLEHINSYNRSSLDKLTSLEGLSPLTIFHPALKQRVLHNIIRRSIGVPGWYFVKNKD